MDYASLANLTLARAVAVGVTRPILWQRPVESFTSIKTCPLHAMLRPLAMVVSNQDGIAGGVKVWNTRMDQTFTETSSAFSTVA